MPINKIADEQWREADAPVCKALVVALLWPKSCAVRRLVVSCWLFSVSHFTKASVFDSPTRFLMASGLRRMQRMHGRSLDAAHVIEKGLIETAK
jgi:hypothetical protein